MGKTQATEEGAFDPVRTGGTIPKRLRPYCLYRRTLLGDLARPAARIVTAGVRATTGEPDLDTPTAPWPTGIPIWIS
jgi:hypothetical protein